MTIKQLREDLWIRINESLTPNKEVELDQLIIDCLADIFYEDEDCEAINNFHKYGARRAEAKAKDKKKVKGK